MKNSHGQENAIIMIFFTVDMFHNGTDRKLFSKSALLQYNGYCKIACGLGWPQVDVSYTYSSAA